MGNFSLNRDGVKGANKIWGENIGFLNIKTASKKDSTHNYITHVNTYDNHTTLPQRDVCGRCDVG